MNLWFVILGAGILTYGIRLSFILLAGIIDFPDPIKHALRFVPTAVFSAIIFPDLFLSSGKFNLSLDNDRLIAGLLAAVIAWRTRSVFWTIVVGMVSLFLIKALVK
jgi:branched-subunit amino acid transport protein